MGMAYAKKSIEYIKKHLERAKEEIIKITVIEALNIDTIYISFINKPVSIRKSIYHIKWKETFVISAGKV